MDKKKYEPPAISSLGTVRDLTALVAPPCESSALDDFSSQDNLCEIEGT